MDITKILDSEYARKVAFGEITIKDVPKKFQKEVKKELIENGFIEEVSPVG